MILDISGALSFRDIGSSIALRAAWVVPILLIFLSNGTEPVSLAIKVAIALGIAVGLILVGFAVLVANGWYPLDRQLIGFVRPDALDDDSAADLRKFARANVLSWFRLPRFLRPRDYTRSFTFFAAAFVSAVLILWGIAALIHAMSPSNTNIMVKLMRLLGHIPFGEWLILPIVGIPLFALWYALRWFSPDARTALARNREPIFVYLRPFKFDDLAIDEKVVNGFRVKLIQQRAEDMLKACLHRLGYLVTIGDPSEKVPETGALRAYYADDEWRNAVSGWVLNAEMTIVLLGSAETEWESGLLQASGRIDRAVFLLPHSIHAPQMGGAFVDFLAASTATATWHAALVRLPPHALNQLIALRLLPNGEIEAVISESPSSHDYRVAIGLLLERIRRTAAPLIRGEWGDHVRDVSEFHVPPEAIT